jgi:hypothetical protein
MKMNRYIFQVIGSKYTDDIVAETLEIRDNMMILYVQGQIQAAFPCQNTILREVVYDADPLIDIVANRIHNILTSKK